MQSQEHFPGRKPPSVDWMRAPRRPAKGVARCEMHPLHHHTGSLRVAWGWEMAEAATEAELSPAASAAQRMAACRSAPHICRTGPAAPQAPPQAFPGPLGPRLPSGCPGNSPRAGSPALTNELEAAHDGAGPSRSTRAPLSPDPRLWRDVKRGSDGGCATVTSGYHWTTPAAICGAHPRDGKHREVFNTANTQLPVSLRSDFNHHPL